MKKGFKKALIGIGLSVMTVGASLFAGCSSVSNLRDQVDQIFCPHKTTKIVEAVTPTCTEDGYTGYEKCLDCGKELTKGVEIEATGHKIEVTKGYAATCTTLGLTDKKTCTVCEAVIEEAKEIPATGHTFKDGKCEDCGAFLSGNDLQEGVDYTGYTVRPRYDYDYVETLLEESSVPSGDMELYFLENESLVLIVYFSATPGVGDEGDPIDVGIEPYITLECASLVEEESLSSHAIWQKGEENVSLTLGEFYNEEGVDVNGDVTNAWVYLGFGNIVSRSDDGVYTAEQLRFILDLIEFVPPASVEAAA